MIQDTGSLSAIGTVTFIPKKLNTSVGRVKKTVNNVRVFIVLFNSLDISEEYDPVILSKILVYNSVVSIP